MYTFVSGIPYAKGLHGELLADLYLPKSKGMHPAVLYIHGGGWSGGSRNQLKRIAAVLADAGYMGVAIDYDLTGQGGTFPVSLIQVKSALRWMRANAATYNIDTSRIAVMGSSAGGELAAEVGLTIGRKGYERGENLEQSSAVAAVAVLNGVLDLTDPSEPAYLVEGYLGGSCTQKLDACHEASPIFLVHTGAPPFFVGHGTADQSVPFQQAQVFVQRLQADHVPVTPIIATGAGHTYWNDDRWFQPNVDALKTFLADTLARH
ncbi:MAG: alpha/beta hydrolase [Acidobacteriaceae bacterium]|nr:alpha/beta hydrolase [Acidobacteriaceae bacterium]